MMSKIENYLLDLSEFAECMQNLETLEFQNERVPQTSTSPSAFKSKVEESCHKKSCFAGYLNGISNWPEFDNGKTGIRKYTVEQLINIYHNH